MTILDYFERIKKLHQLILNSNTGTPSELAKKLKTSRSNLYNFLDFLKLNGAPIEYDKRNKSYYYTQRFELSEIFKIEK